jgi:Domain of unknown function (DUF4112)
MDAWIAYLLVSLVVVTIIGVAGYLVLRTMFMRAADRMAHHIDRALSQFATVGMSGRAGQVSAAAARAAAGRFTHLGAYAAAEGVSEEAARRQFTRSIERVARLMDSAVKIPVIGRVGLDAILGLFPVAGDAASAAVSISLIARSVRYGIPREIVTRMLANVLVDLLLGAVPLIGDLADVWFKANERNVRLLKEYLGDEARNTIDAEVVSRA